MDPRVLKRGVALLCAAVFFASAFPAGVFAAPVAPAAAADVLPAIVGRQANIGPDAYEPDGTTATAKPMPVRSYHTWQPSAGINDDDYMYFDVAVAGTPVFLEICSVPWTLAVTDPMLLVYDSAGSVLGLSDTKFTMRDQDGGFVFIAPSPGRYYVRAFSDDAFGQWGEYYLYGYQGIGRRINGATRYDTAVNVSQLLYSTSGNADPAQGLPRGPMTGIVLANGKRFGDAMTAGMLAAVTGSPLMLAETPNRLTPAMKAELERLARDAYNTGGLSKSAVRPVPGSSVVPVGKIPLYVVGGPASISEALAEELHANPYLGDVIRVGGADRYEVAANVMGRILEIHRSGLISGGPQPVSAAEMTQRYGFIVNGDSPVDVVAAAPVASAMCAPLLLVKKNSLPAATESMLASAGVTDIVVVGGTGGVSAALYDTLSTKFGGRIERIVGVDRYDMCKMLVDFQRDHTTGNYNPNRMIVVSGVAPADAMTVVPLSRHMGYAPVLFTKPRALSHEVREFIDDNKPLTETSYMIGGYASITKPTYNAWSRYGQPFSTNPR